MSPQLRPILSAFFPGLKAFDCQPIGQGMINDTYKVRTEGDQQQWLLQRINTAVFNAPVELMENFIKIAPLLPAHASLQPRLTVNGAACFKDDADGFWRILPYLEDTYAPEQLPSRAQAYEAARAYGLFLKNISTLNTDQWYIPIQGFHDTVQRYQHFRAVIAQNVAGRVAHTELEIEQLLRAEKYALQIDGLIKSGQLPLRLVHNDTKAGNVLLNRATGKAVAVIDWDTVMPGTVLSDYGDMVRTFVPDRYEDAETEGMTLRTEVWAALDHGFLAATADFLTATERGNLYLGALWIVGEQALRFLTDYLAGDKYYKTGYPEHNLIRARNQLRLLHLMEAYDPNPIPLR